MSQPELYPPFRECRFCITFDDGTVFADFDVDASGRVYPRRISFDGYGCYTSPPDVARMNAEDSEQLLAMVEAGALGPTADALLRRYFESVASLPWSEPLREYGLLE